MENEDRIFVVTEPGDSWVYFAGVFWLRWETPLFDACDRCIAFDAKLKGWETTEMPAEPSP